MRKELYTIGGLPGSGKTTKAANLVGNLRYLKPAHFEADDYFMVDGVYRFNPAKIGEAHAQCQQSVARCMRLYDPVIVVANTFSQVWERVVYGLLAEAYGYQVQHFDLFDAGLTDQELAARCVHGVPVDKIAQMRARWEK